jgi:hypothetical protein
MKEVAAIADFEPGRSDSSVRSLLGVDLSSIVQATKDAKQTLIARGTCTGRGFFSSAGYCFGRRKSAPGLLHSVRLRDRRAAAQDCCRKLRVASSLAPSWRPGCPLLVSSRGERGGKVDLGRNRPGTLDVSIARRVVCPPAPNPSPIRRSETLALSAGVYEKLAHRAQERSAGLPPSE